MKENKDKKVQIFRLETRLVDSYEQVVKIYIHSKESGGIWAFVRQLSENERFSAKAVQIEETTQFKIVYNPKINNELFIEFNGNTYQIVSIDKYQFNHTNLVINANQVLVPEFDEVMYENYWSKEKV